jgi:hypothetical protein
LRVFTSKLSSNGQELARLIVDPENAANEKAQSEVEQFSFVACCHNAARPLPETLVCFDHLRKKEGGTITKTTRDYPQKESAGVVIVLILCI